MLSDKDKIELSKNYNNMLKYRHINCNYNASRDSKYPGICYFHYFKSKEFGSYTKTCNGINCPNYKNSLSFLKMCINCIYAGSEHNNTSLICNYYKENPNAHYNERQITTDVFNEYKCTNYKELKNKNN